MANIEILAPVGSEEMLHAAVFSGADAVYLGFSGFNARTGAGSFDADSLKEAVRFCHARGVKVHVALNTTVYGGELASLCDAIRAVAASGADAVICQDLAVATLIGQLGCDLPNEGGHGQILADDRVCPAGGHRPDGIAQRGQFPAVHGGVEGHMHRHAPGVAEADGLFQAVGIKISGARAGVEARKSPDKPHLPR